MLLPAPPLGGYTPAPPQKSQLRAESALLAEQEKAAILGLNAGIAEGDAEEGAPPPPEPGWVPGQTPAMKEQDEITKQTEERKQAAFSEANRFLGKVSNFLSDSQHNQRVAAMTQAPQASATLSSRQVSSAYKVVTPPGLEVLAGANVHGGPAPGVPPLAYGEVFQVVEETRGLDGRNYLKLADGRGWAYDLGTSMEVVVEKVKKEQLGMRRLTLPFDPTPGLGDAFPSRMPASGGDPTAPQGGAQSLEWYTDHLRSFLETHRGKKMAEEELRTFPPGSYPTFEVVMENGMEEDKDRKRDRDRGRDRDRDRDRDRRRRRSPDDR